MEPNRLILGNCIDVMRTFPENSIDCIVTDPPYGLKFMGKKWDQALPPPEAFHEMCRILKPGALAFVMSSPRQDLVARMVLLLEEAGFKTDRSYIDYIYKCLSEDTEVLTIDGWERFNKSNSFIAKPIIIYDIENDTYRWEVPHEWSSYYIKDTCYRVKSDYTDQLVTRGHRIPVEFEGELLYKFVEEITPTDKLLYLEDLSRMWNNISYNPVSGTEHTLKILQSQMQRHEQETGFNEVYRDSPRRYEEMVANPQGAEKEETNEEGYDWGEKPCLEGWRNILQNSWKLPGCKICSVSCRVQGDGKKRRVCDGAPPVSSAAPRAFTEKEGDCSSYRSRPIKQQTRESSIIQEQQGTQTTRTWASYRTTMATITKEYYEGVVFCPTVSTGFFVARRNGQIFITGNTGFPKAYDVASNVSKRIDRI